MNVSFVSGRSTDAVNDVDRPPTPFNLTVRPFRNSLYITWSVPAAASDRHPPDYHVVEYRTVGKHWVPLTDRIAGNVTAFNWTTASRGATYRFRVVSFYDRPPPSQHWSSPSDAAAPSRTPDDDEEEDSGDWQSALRSLPSSIVTIETGGQ